MVRESSAGARLARFPTDSEGVSPRSFFRPVSFVALAWKCYNIPADWTYGAVIVRHTLGLVSNLPALSHEWFPC